MKLSMIFNTKFDLIFSLGENCSVAHYLHRFGLRDMSSPFDWVCNASFQTRINLLTNDFQGFLEISDLQIYNPAPFGDILCDAYYDRRYRFKFIHDFPKGKSIEETYPAVKDKYNRRVERLLGRIKKTKKVLVVWAGFDFDVSDSEFEAAIDQLKQKFVGVDFYLLAIQNDLECYKIYERVINSHLIHFRGPFRPIPELTWGDKNLWNIVFSRINSRWCSYWYWMKALIYRRVKSRKWTIYYFFNIPLLKFKRGFLKIK